MRRDNFDSGCLGGDQLEYDPIRAEDIPNTPVVEWVCMILV